jgi:hypothetical protein
MLFYRLLIKKIAGNKCIIKVLYSANVQQCECGYCHHSLSFLLVSSGLFFLVNKKTEPFTKNRGQMKIKTF